MTVTLSPGDIVQVTAYCSDGEQVAINDFFYLCGTESGASATDSNFSVQWDAIMAPLYAALLYDAATYLGSMVQKISPAPIARRIPNVANSALGTAGAIGLPRQAAGLLSWGSALAGPSARGRSYLPFPAAADNELEGEPTNGYRTRAADLGSAVFSFAIVNGVGPDAIAVHLVLLNRDTLATKIITDFGVKKKWATQKRRGSFGKANVSPF